MTTTTTTNGYSGGYKANGSAAGAPFRKQPPSLLPHIDDIMNVTIDYDPHLPTNKLLGYADDLLRQAENRRAFSGRIDIALTLYVKALLVFDLMRKTKGWETLADNRAQKEKYNRLCKQVEALQSVYQQIKLDIKTDNLRTGVQPMRQQSQPPAPHSTNIATTGSLAPNNSLPHEAGSSNGSQTPGFSTVPAKTKPTVRPKPEALHGHALHPVDGVAKTPPKRAADDLTARFSKLRATTSPPRKPVEQDPRIRTHPLPAIPAHSTDPRDAGLSTDRPSLSIDSNLFEMPKLPGAIYKPARGTVSTEAAELPSSSSRRFSVARSLTSGSLNSPVIKSPTGGGNIPEEPNDWVKRTPTIPEGDILSVTDLLTLMKEGSKSVSILLIDIRSREAFDEGHIMSQATICIEPEVLRRKDISATEIAESMVLAPSAEQLNFERRHRFDVIVFYDQSSSCIGTNKGDLTALAVQGLYNALTHFDFGGGEANSKQPKLLQGGLEAWTSVMGNNSLATTESSVGQPHRSPKLSSHPPARRQSFAPKPIQDAAEARRWEESTKDIETYKNYAREVDDVLRGFDKRYPRVPESMTSVPATAPSKGNGTYSSQHPAVPPEPERPRPTRAKSTTFGLSSSEDPQAAIKPGRKGPGGNRSDRKRVGLVNPANLCYANASLQALFHTPGFAEDLFRGGWERDYRVPMKSGEKIPNPQLLAKMLAQLFAWMDKALIHPLEARTLMQYVRHVSGSAERQSRGEQVVFGDPKEQQDAQEFFSYVMQSLDDETNKRRNNPELTTSTSLKPERDGDAAAAADDPNISTLHKAVQFWQEHISHNDSIVSKYWRGIEAGTVSCQRPGCGFKSTTFAVLDNISCSVAKPDNGFHSDLSQSLREYTKLEHLEARWECDRCKEKGFGRSPATKRTAYARLPERLMIMLKRTGAGDPARGGPPTKINAKFEFPIQNLDMEPYFVDAADRHIDRTNEEVAKMYDEERQFDPRYKYDCYAAICHSGSDYRSGHYVAYVRDYDSQDPTDWLKFDDTRVNSVKIGSGTDDVAWLYGKGNTQAYVLFYRRKP